MAFKTFEEIRKLIAANPEILNVARGFLADATQVASLPSRAAGTAKRGIAELGEGVAGLVQKGAEFAEEYQPKISLGDDGPSMKIPYNPLMPFGDAGDVASMAGLAKERLSRASDASTESEKFFDSAVDAMDKRIGGAVDKPTPTFSGRGGVDEEALKRSERKAARKEEYAENRAKMKAIRERNAAKRAAEDDPYAPDASNQLHGVPNESALGEGEVTDVPYDPMMGTTGDNPDDYDLAGGADKEPEEPEVDYDQKAIDLFKTVHATEFDPKSSKDKGKLDKMKKLLAKQGGLGDMTPNQFALQVYRND